MHKYLSELYRSQWSHFVRLEVMWCITWLRNDVLQSFRAIQNDCVRLCFLYHRIVMCWVFSCFAVVLVSTLTLLMPNCIDFSTLSVLVWLDFFGKTWIVLSFYNWIQFKVELMLQLCWPVHPCDITEYYYGPMELHFLSVYLVRSIWFLIFVNIAYTNIGIRRHAWWFDHESSSCRGLSAGFRHP